jgi:hypothetical protein
LWQRKVFWTTSINLGDVRLTDATASCDLSKDPDDGEGSHVVAYVFDPALSDLLGLTERSTHGDDRALVLFDPCLPRGNSLIAKFDPLLTNRLAPYLVDLGLADKVKQANSLDELRRVRFDADAAEVMLAIRDAFHPVTLDDEQIRPSASKA